MKVRDIGLAFSNGPDSRLAVLIGSEIESFGDSITDPGYYASDSAHQYIGIVKAYVGGNLNSYAQGGRGLYHMAAMANASIGVNTSGLFASMCGLNDYAAAGATLNPNTDRKNAGCHNILLMNAFASTIYNVLDPGWTFVGNWGADNAYGSKGFWKSVQIGTGTATITLTGTDFGFAFIGGDGMVITQGNITIKVDGVVKKTFSLNNVYDGYALGSDDNHLGPYGVGVFGLSNTAHVIEIDSDALCPVNYIAKLNLNKNPVAILKEIRLTSSGYVNIAYGGAGNAINDARIDHMNDTMATAAQEWINAGANIKIIDRTDLVTPTDYYSDGIHPVDSGHAKLGAAFTSSIKLL